jgi:pimeloyl-ACP methyl ester carboxylesterase
LSADADGHLERSRGGIPDDVHADYLTCSDGDRFVKSMRMPAGIRRMCLPICPQIAAPVTIINGRHDRVVPLPNAEFLAERLPTSRLVVVDGGHFI